MTFTRSQSNTDKLFWTRIPAGLSCYKCSDDDVKCSFASCCHGNQSKIWWTKGVNGQGWPFIRSGSTIVNFSITCTKRFSSNVNEKKVGRRAERVPPKYWLFVFQFEIQALKLLLKLRQVRPVTFQLLQQTRIGNAVNSWKQRNSGRLEDKTLRQADKLIQG